MNALFIQNIPIECDYLTEFWRFTSIINQVVTNNLSLECRFHIKYHFMIQNKLGYNNINPHYDW